MDALKKALAYFLQPRPETQLVKPEPVVNEELPTYDTLHANSFAEHQSAQEVIKRAVTKGMRQPSNKELQQANQTVFNYKKKKSQQFLDEYTKMIAFYRVQIEGTFEQLPNGLIRPALHIADYIPKVAERKLEQAREATQEPQAPRKDAVPSPFNG